MIPHNFRAMLASIQNAGFFQSLALLLFMLFFVGVLFVVFKRPKKYYNEVQNSPLDLDNQD